VIAYLDPSVILSRLFNQKPEFHHWDQITHAVTSELLVLECKRTIDRAVKQSAISSEKHLQLLRSLQTVLDGVSLIRLTPTVLDRAAQPFSFVIRTLDAIHLVSAQLYEEEKRDGTVFCTHDAQLRTAAGLVGFKTLGA
jgi:predicted nucleic acid-binding protein